LSDSSGSSGYPSLGDTDAAVLQGRDEAQLQPATRIPPQPSHTETPTHIETRTHNQCGDTIEKQQAPDEGCINVRNMSSIEEMK